jgi:L-alanine-DL-glutamate epimerase-like enolase superfamily enzyme
MAGDNVRKMVYEFLGKPGDRLPEHVQTVKITATAHAKLRALADLVASRSKTPLAADLLMAAIDDAIEALPDEMLDEATADKLRGVYGGKVMFGGNGGTFAYEGVTVEVPPEPRTMREIVLERADLYLSHDEHERWEKETATASSSELAKQNGAHN